MKRQQPLNLTDALNALDSAISQLSAATMTGTREQCIERMHEVRRLKDSVDLAHMQQSVRIAKLAA